MSKTVGFPRETGPQEPVIRPWRAQRATYEVLSEPHNASLNPDKTTGMGLRRISIIRPFPRTLPPTEPKSSNPRGKSPPRQHRNAMTEIPPIPPPHSADNSSNNRRC